MKLSEIKNPDFYDEEEDIILAENLISEVYYVINELYCIFKSDKDKKEQFKKLRRQIAFYFKWQKVKRQKDF